jgi:hypothetical protein
MWKIGRLEEAAMNADPSPTLETDPRFPSGPWTGFFLQKAIPGRHLIPDRRHRQGEPRQATVA